MFNKIAKKNPGALKEPENEQSREIADVKETIRRLIFKMENAGKIVRTRKQEDIDKIRVIHSNSGRTLDFINEKYSLLMKKLKDDYELEKLLTIKMYMQQELNIFKPTKVEHYIPTNQPLNPIK